MSRGNELYPGLTSGEAKRLRHLIHLLQGLSGRYDMLTLNEQKELKCYLIKMQVAQANSLKVNASDQAGSAWFRA